MSRVVRWKYVIVKHITERYEVEGRTFEEAVAQIQYVAGGVYPSFHAMPTFELQGVAPLEEGPG